MQVRLWEFGTTPSPKPTQITSPSLRVPGYFASIPLSKCASKVRQLSAPWQIFQQTGRAFCQVSSSASVVSPEAFTLPSYVPRNSSIVSWVIYRVLSRPLPELTKNFSPYIPKLNTPPFSTVKHLISQTNFIFHTADFRSSRKNYFLWSSQWVPDANAGIVLIT